MPETTLILCEILTTLANMLPCAILVQASAPPYFSCKALPTKYHKIPQNATKCHKALACAPCAMLTFLFLGGCAAGFPS